LARQGHYAFDPANVAAYPPAELSVDRIGDLADHELAAFLGGRDGECTEQERR
jgi:hypothetical protein